MRVCGVEIPSDKRIEIALTYIYGIGRSRSNDILDTSQVDGDKRTHELTSDEVTRIRNIIEDEFTIRVEDFTYTGGGLSSPGVFFYLDDDLAFTSGTAVGDNLHGQNFQDEDLGTIHVPGGLDGLNAVSVYCLGAQADFGSGLFQIPEPATASLLGLAALTLARRPGRSRRRGATGR